MKKIFYYLFLTLLSFTFINIQAQNKSDKHICHKAKKIIHQDLPNFYKVSNKIYRGAQPKKGNGMIYLEKLGIRTVLNLRLLHDDKKLLKDTTLKYYRFKMSAWSPKEKEIIAFLKIINNKENVPLFIHCKHGSDRTGTLVAFYRIIFCGWSKDKAIYEMTKGGFGFHKIWRNLIHFIRESNIENIKLRAGIK